MLELRLLRSSLVATAVGIAVAVPAHAQDEADGRNVRVQLGERLTLEDNLYRLPDAIDPADLLGPSARRDDRIVSTFLGIDGRWQQGGQEVVLDALVNANRFGDNEALDNTSGTANLTWNWRLASRWSGQLGGRRERTLASFANRSSLARDLVDTAAVRGAVQFDVGPRVRATVNGAHAETAHDDEARRGDDRELRTAAAGLEYHTPLGNAIGVEYTRADATFESGGNGLAAGSASDYEEREASVNLTYALSNKVALDASTGHVERTYPYAAASDFSGGVWRAALRWSPGDKTELIFQRWRELSAHVDAESDHFVSTATGLTAAWTPVDTISIALQLSSEDQRYIRGGIDAPDEAARNDTAAVGTLSMSYVPSERVSVDVSYRRESRDSNRFRFDYDAASLGVGCEVRF